MCYSEGMLLMSLTIFHLIDLLMDSITTSGGGKMTPKITSFGGKCPLFGLSASCYLWNRLDHGDGKNLSLDECPRERLEQEVSKPQFCA